MAHFQNEPGTAAGVKGRKSKKDDERTKTAAAIRRAIDKEGVEYVLTDMLLDPTAALAKYRRQ